MTEFEKHTVGGKHRVLMPVQKCHHVSGRDLPVPSRDMPLGSFARCSCGKWFGLHEMWQDPYDRYWRMVSRRKQRALERKWWNP